MLRYFGNTLVSQKPTVGQSEHLKTRHMKVLLLTLENYTAYFSLCSLFRHSIKRIINQDTVSTEMETEITGSNLIMYIFGISILKLLATFSGHIC